MVIWLFYWYMIYLIFKLLSSLKIMKNRRHCHFKWMKKFKQIFKKIGQTKALDLYMCSREFLLCCCSYLNGESEKQTHLCRTIGLSDYRTVGPAGCRTNGLSNYSYAPLLLCLFCIIKKSKTTTGVVVVVIVR